MKEIRISDLPSASLKRISDDISNYATGFFSVEGLNGKPRLQLRGSGTLVSAKTQSGNSVYAILTAGHVVEHLPTQGRICLALGKCSLSTGSIEVQGLRYQVFPRGISPDLGPDLGLIVLPSNVASALSARRLFVDLDRSKNRLEQTELLDGDGIWVIQGIPDEQASGALASDGVLDIRMHHRSFISCIESKTIQDQHDTYDVPVQHGDDIPYRFTGVSGGGLWQVLLRLEGDEVVHSEPVFSGVAFFQVDRGAKESMIRCHGRQSCYSVALSWLYGLN